MNEVIIKKEDLLNNIDEIKRLVTKEDYTIFAVVKGNGYGLDIVSYTKFLIENGFDHFAVANIKEALTLRENNVDKEILLMSPSSDKEYLNDLIKNNITLTIDSIEGAILVDKICKKLERTIDAHIKINTGLSRYGFNYDDIEDIKKLFEETENINFIGIFSHFSTSFSKDSSYCDLQFSRFKKVLELLKQDGIEFKYKHICNSSAFYKYPNMHLTAARIGSMFLGYGGNEKRLKTIGELHTKINKIRILQKGDFIGYGNIYRAKKETKVAILPIGYSDGIGLVLYDQRFKLKSKLGKVYYDIKKLFKDDNMTLNINGEKMKVLGQIGMSNIMVDITGKKYNENDDLYIKCKVSLIDSSIKRIYK